MKNIATWLDGLALSRYADSFAENHIDAEMLLALTDDDLKELGILSLGHRKKLLSAIAALSDAPETSPILGPGEYRQVTVMFADLSGFTSLSASLGAEETHRLLNRYFEALDKIVAEYGGRVDKHIGDNVMAVFGAPVAHNDDPERAVRAAFDMHRAINHIADQIGRPLAIHIGIASGRVVASGTGSDTHREYTVTGEAVNFAARLQDLADSSETLVSEAVQRAVADLVDCDDLGEKQLKGFDHAVSVYRLRSLSSSNGGKPSAPLCGRDHEVARFAIIAADTYRTGIGQIVALRGQAGIGKTRLVQEFRAIGKTAGFMVHSGQVLDFGTGRGPSHPIRDRQHSRTFFRRHRSDPCRRG
ncbi:MAG: adenylate/guanylate cyclase domain-containing protein [Proteobacteria bacterium]|nr:adenylate/guanylate cyclase domain-containing protein [Pseudomonadota bacterium]